MPEQIEWTEVDLILQILFTESAVRSEIVETFRDSIDLFAFTFDKWKRRIHHQIQLKIEKAY